MGIAVEAGGLGGLFWLSSQTTEKSGSSTGPDIFELSHLLEALLLGIVFYDGNARGSSRSVGGFAWGELNREATPTVWHMT